MWLGKAHLENLPILRSAMPKSGCPRWLTGKESGCQYRRHELDPWVRKIPWRKKWQPTPVFLPGESHGRRSLMGYTVHGIAKSRTRLSDFTFTFTFVQFVQQIFIKSPVYAQHFENDDRRISGHRVTFYTRLTFYTNQRALMKEIGEWKRWLKTQHSDI